jgi:hypothetical protein
MSMNRFHGQWGLRERVYPYLRTSSIDWAQLSRFYLKTEREFSLRNVVFGKINRIVFYIKTRRWIMSKNIIFVLINQFHLLKYFRATCFGHLRPSSGVCKQQNVSTFITNLHDAKLLY